MWISTYGYNLRRPCRDGYHSIIVLNAENGVIRSNCGDPFAKPRQWVWAHPTNLVKYLNMLIEANILPFFISRYGSDLLDDVIDELLDGAGFQGPIHCVLDGFLDLHFPNLKVINEDRLEPIIRWKWQTMFKNGSDIAVVIFGAPSTPMDDHYISMMELGYYPITSRETRNLILTRGDNSSLNSKEHGKIVLLGFIPSRYERMILREELRKRGYKVYLCWSTLPCQHDKSKRLPSLCQDLYKEKFENPTGEQDVYRID